LCRARGEEVAEARAAGSPAEAARAYRRLVAVCPAALQDPVTRGDYAEALAAAGDRDAAQAVLAAAPPPGDPRLDLLAGRLAADAGDVEAARTAYERVLGKRASDAVVTEAKMRLALLDAAGDPARATAALLGLAGEAQTPALRAALLGTAADTAARAGRFEEALGLLERAATLGPEGAAQADGRRAEILGRWVAALGAADDAAGVAAVYAAYATDIDAAAAPEDALAIARALVAPAVVEREAPARVLLVAGAAAAAEGVWDAASEAYDRALGAGDGTERLEAAAGLARLALARGDRTAARSALARAGDLKD